jgi:hypothetical protein
MAIEGFYRAAENDDLRISEDGLVRVSADYAIIPAGIRVSEAGDTRVTEDGIIRTTNGFELPDAALQATGSVTSTINISTFVSAELSSAGSTLNAGVGTFVDQASMAAEGTIAASGLVVLIEYAELNSIGTMAPVDSLRTAFGEAPLSATGSKAAAGLKTLFGSLASGTDEVTRITEAGDIRVLENGTDTRTAIAAYGNIVFATIVGNPSKTFFSSQPYYKDAGSWKTFIPNVKWNGAWTQNFKIYKHTNGAWKRSY